MDRSTYRDLTQDQILTLAQQVGIDTNMVGSWDELFALLDQRLSQTGQQAPTTPRRGTLGSILSQPTNIQTYPTLEEIPRTPMGVPGLLPGTGIVPQVIDRNTLARMTIPQLKQAMTERRIPYAGLTRKNDLIQRFLEHAAPDQVTRQAPPVVDNAPLTPQTPVRAPSTPTAPTAPGPNRNQPRLQDLEGIARQLFPDEGAFQGEDRDELYQTRQEPQAFNPFGANLTASNNANVVPVPSLRQVQVPAPDNVYTREELGRMTVTQLRQLGRSRDVILPSRFNKPQIIQALLDEQGRRNPVPQQPAPLVVAPSVAVESNIAPYQRDDTIPEKISVERIPNDRPLSAPELRQYSLEEIQRLAGRRRYNRRYINAIANGTLDEAVEGFIQEEIRTLPVTARLTPGDLTLFTDDQIRAIATRRNYRLGNLAGDQLRQAFLTTQNKVLRPARTMPHDEIFTEDDLVMMPETTIMTLAGQRRYNIEDLESLRGPVLRSEFLRRQERYAIIGRVVNDVNELPTILSQDLPEVELADFVDIEPLPESNDPGEIYLQVTGHGRRSGRYVIEDIMGVDPSILVQVLNSLGYTNFTGNYDDAIALIWWSYIFREIAPSRVNDERVRQAVGGASAQQLLDLFQGRYPERNATDKATLTFVVLNRQIVHVRNIPPERMERYQYVMALPPQRVMQVARYLYNYLGEIPSFYTPYRHLAIQENISVMEPFIIQYNGRPQEMAPLMGMVIPVNVDPEQYYFSNVRYYAPVLTRPANIPPPPMVQGGTQLDRTLLERYTDDEIIDAYGPFNFQGWADRPTFLSNVVSESQRGSHWHFRSRRCANDDRMDVVEFDDRIKDDPVNPIISYGTLTNYRCYTMQELLFTFRETGEEGFRFAVPDFMRGDPLSDFPLESIRQLRQLLVDTSNPVFEELIARIDQGLAELNVTVTRMRALRRTYLDSPEQAKAMIRDYLAWLFVTGMWMRHWRGPGFPWPHSAESLVRTQTAGYCTTINRDENVQVAFQQRNLLLERMREFSPDLEQWALALPRIEYNFRTEEVRFGRETLQEILRLVEIGRYCLMNASDQLLRTGYYLAVQILDLNVDTFNAMINAYIGDPNQPPFVPRQYQITGHPDLDFRLRLEPTEEERAQRANRRNR